MHSNKTKKGVLLLLLSGMGAVYAQEAVPATGGDATGASGAVSYSVGQVVYTAQTGPDGTISQGVQQPYDISSAGTGEALEQIQLTAYPNPTKDVLTLSLEEGDYTGYSYELYNSHGQLISRKELTANRIDIPMQELQSATYLLKVVATEQAVKTFTIIKH